jgi:hypothetical protein
MSNIDSRSYHGRLSDSSSQTRLKASSALTPGEGAIAMQRWPIAFGTLKLAISLPTTSKGVRDVPHVKASLVACHLSFSYLEAYILRASINQIVAKLVTKLQGFLSQ